MVEEKTETKKSLILEKALQVFVEHDYSRATVDEIAARADIGKGTVYRYFKNKEELFLELLILAAAARQEAIIDNIKMIADLRGKLGRFIMALLRFAKNQPEYFKLLTMKIGAEPEDFQTKVNRIQNEYQELIYQILQDGIRQNKFREINPLIATNLLCKLIEGALQVFEDEPNFSADQIVLTMLDLIWNGFGKKS